MALAIITSGILSGSGLSVASDGLLGESGLPGLTPFEGGVGLIQGRASSGEGFSFFLGSSREGDEWDLAAGDFAELSQVADLSLVELVSFASSFRAPRGAPAGLRWRLSLKLDTVDQISILGWPGYARDTADLAINTAGLVGDHKIAIRLELEAY